ncbi:MAG: glycosyltransferase [Flavobacterium sp.]|nr:MAG: glycosyltransferase [Flavobacterium sp.]
MLITVLMPVYNAEDYLAQSIESILTQSCSNFEFLIIDDGSTDNSLGIINEYAQRDSRIVVLENKVNIGLAKSLNKGVGIAKGSYIARQDADDLSAPHRLDAQLSYALSHPEVDLIGSNSFVIDINGEIVCQVDSYSKITDRWQGLLMRKAIFPHGSAFIKKSKLVEVGLYDERFFYSQDGELWLRLISHGAIVHTISLPLYYYREMPKQTLKKYDAQAAFHQVKRMIYVDKVSTTDIDNKLSIIASSLAAKSKSNPASNFMAIYWKSLANTAYFNSMKGRSRPFKYLIRSIRANRNEISNFYYLKAFIVYLLPRSLTAFSRKS